MHGPGIGEFDGVGQQIEHDLAHTGLIARKQRRRIARDGKGDCKPLIHGLWLKQRHAALDRLGNLERHFDQRELASLDP